MKTKKINGVKFIHQIDDSWTATRDYDGALEVLNVSPAEFDRGVWVWDAHLVGGEYGIGNNRSINFVLEGDSLSLNGAMKDATEAFGKWKGDLAYLASL